MFSEIQWACIVLVYQTIKSKHVRCHNYIWCLVKILFLYLLTLSILELNFQNSLLILACNVCGFNYSQCYVLYSDLTRNYTLKISGKILKVHRHYFKIESLMTYFVASYD